MALWDKGEYVQSERPSDRENPGPFKWRELPRLVIDILRDSPEPLTTSHIQAAVRARKGLVLTTPAERRSLSRRVTGALNDKRRQGVIVSDGKMLDRHLWRLAKDGEGVVCEHRIAEAKARRERRTAERIARRRNLT